MSKYSRLFTLGVLLIFGGLSQPTEAARIVAAIHDAETRQPLPEANGKLNALGLQARSDTSGSLTLTVEQAGTYRLAVSHVAYEPYFIDLELDAEDLQLEIFLQPRIYLSDEIVVTATRTPYLLKNVPVTTDIISREEARSTGATTVDEALESMTGIQIDEHMSGSAVSLWGLDPTRVLILIDGERVVGRVRGAIDLSQISLENVDQIEVVKGVGSTLYGSDAIGGVINIITRRGNGPGRASASATYGTFNTYTQTLEAQSRVNNWDLVFGGKFDRTDGFDLTPETIHTNGKERTKQSNLDGKASRILLHNLTGTFSGSFYWENKKWIEANDRGGRIYAYDDVENNYRYASTAKFLFNPNPNTFLDFNLYGTYYHHVWDKTISNQLINRSKTEDLLYETSLLASHTYSPGHVITMGGDLTVQSLKSSEVADGEKDVKSGNIYATYEWKPFEQLVLLPGVRVESHSTYGGHTNASINLMVTPHPRLRLRSSYAGGYRAPSIKELYYRFDHSAEGYLVIGGGEGLQPEISRNATATIEYSYSGVGLHRLTYFYNHLENLIEFEKVDENPSYPTGIYQYRNIFRAYTTGFEWQSQVKPAAWMSLVFSYTRLTAKDLATGNWLLGRPKQSISGKLALSSRRLGATITAWGNWRDKKLWTPKTDQNNFESEEWAPEQHEISLSVTKRINKHFEFFARAENIADQSNAEYGYWPGRRFFAGLRFTTEKEKP